MLGALVLWVTSAEPQPEWTTSRRLFDAPAFVLPSGAVRGGLAAWDPLGFSIPSVALHPELAFGLPERLELGLAADWYQVPSSGLPSGRWTPVGASLRWAPVEWGAWVGNPTIGLAAKGTLSGRHFVGPLVGAAGTFVSPRWRWSLDADALFPVLASDTTPITGARFLGSQWLIDARAQSSVELGPTLALALSGRFQRAGPSPDAGHRWGDGSRLYSTSHASWEALASVQLVLGPVIAELGAGVLDWETPEDPGYTTDSLFPIMRASVSGGFGL